MSQVYTRDLVERWVAAVLALDEAAIAPLIHPDYVEDYPQSGERIRGMANFREIIERYPGGPPQATALDRIIGAEDRWVMSASAIPMRIDGAGDQYTIVYHVVYPDGTRWHTIQFIQLKDDRIHRVTSFWAPAFDPPVWRAPFVESMGEGHGADSTT